MNCKIKITNINKTDEKSLFQLKYLLLQLLNNHKIKNISFFINCKDFPILTKKGIEPFHHIFGENVPLTSYKFNSYCPILSFGNRLDIFQDILIPTDDCINVITRKYFPPKCDNYYYDIVPNTPWKDKIETAVFRGSSTGCATDFRNPRLLITKLNQEWANTNKGYIDAGITRAVYKGSKYIGEDYISYVDLQKLNINPVEPMTMVEQSKYKYILDIEGNAAAYRLGYILSFKSVLLKVESEYKIWIDEFLKEGEHYLLIKRDFSNLKETIDWCRSHDKECKKIADNAYKIYKKCYNEEFILKYTADKLNNLEIMTFES
jgi:hypothetical protein